MLFVRSHLDESSFGEDVTRLEKKEDRRFGHYIPHTSRSRQHNQCPGSLRQDVMKRQVSVVERSVAVVVVDVAGAAEQTRIPLHKKI